MRVSVIIPTCNRNFTLALAIKSALPQIGKSGEIIVINDGIRPLNIKQLPNDTRIVVKEDFPRSIDELGFPSGGYCRNKGLEVAKGKYVAFLDDDDQFEPKKLETQLSLMEKNDWGATCTDAFISTLPFRFFFPRKLFSSFYKNETNKHLRELSIEHIPIVIEKTHLDKHNFLITSTVICKTSILTEVGRFNNIRSHGQLINGVKDFEDWNLWRRIAMITEFNYIDQPLTHYKRGSLSKLRKKLSAKLRLQSKNDCT